MLGVRPEMFYRLLNMVVGPARRELLVWYGLSSPNFNLWSLKCMK